MLQGCWIKLWNDLIWILSVLIKYSFSPEMLRTVLDTRFNQIPLCLSTLNLGEGLDRLLLNILYDEKKTFYGFYVHYDATRRKNGYVINP